MKPNALGLILTTLLLAPPILTAQSSRLTSVEKVADGVWMAQTDKGSNAAWFLMGDEVVVVDCGSDAETGQALLDKIKETAGKPARFVVITHSHSDHAGGVAPFVTAGAKIVCQETAAAAVAPLVQSLRGKEGVLAISERLSFVGGPRRAAIYFLGPAHTAGDLFVYLPDEKILLAGDLVMGKRAPFMRSADANPKGWENILARLGQLDIEKVVPGHGVLGTRQLIAETYGYVKKVNELAQMMRFGNVPDDLIEARLRQPDSGVQSDAITPELIANIRAVMRVAQSEPGATPSPAPRELSRTPAAKK